MKKEAIRGGFHMKYEIFSKVLNFNKSFFNHFVEMAKDKKNSRTT